MGNEFEDDEYDDEESNEKHYVGIYAGIVRSNDDPDELGRVRIEIPGFIEPQSAWALPAGTISGGIKGRGFYDPPDVGSDVLIMFLAGDVDHPVYFCGFWGIPDEGGRETPGPVNEAGASERVKIKCYETSRYLLLFDHRDADLQLTLRDKITGDEISIKPAGIDVKTAANLTMTAAGSASLVATSQLSLNGSTIKLNGGGPGVGRVGDAVRVTIPSGTVHVTNPFGTPPTIPNPFPIVLTGTITSGSGTVESG